jgi:hypothetical protein
VSKMSRRIVVDASVARAAGETEHPHSERCREFLLDMLLICHRVVMSDDITREWEKHASGYSVKWLRAMRKRGKVVRVTPEATGLMDRIAAAADWSEKDMAAMEKDLLLLLGALATDRLVASGDGKVRDRFAKAAVSVAEIAPVTWVNPSLAEDHCGTWLHAGARHDDACALRVPES